MSNRISSSHHKQPDRQSTPSYSRPSLSPINALNSSERTQLILERIRTGFYFRDEVLRDLACRIEPIIL